MENKDYMQNREIVVNEVDVWRIYNRTEIDGFDYAINPYTGCTFNCKYCFASFMSRFSKHQEKWGEFLDVKNWTEFKPEKLAGKRFIIGTVTDPYNPYEEKFGRTRKVLQQLKEGDCEVVIQTKSPLVLRDLTLLKSFKNLKVVLSLCTLDEKVASELENGLTVKDRLDAMKKLHDNGVKVVLSVAPILPGLTDVEAIINKCGEFVDEFWFDSLELRNEFKIAMLNFIKEKRPDLVPLYIKIYIGGKDDFFKELSKQIEKLCNGKVIKNKIITKLKT